MAPSASSTTRRSRVVHWLFLSRRAVFAVAAVDVAVSLAGLPLPLHAAAGLGAHLVVTVLVRPR
jgi:hypothetical protein